MNLYEIRMRHYSPKDYEEGIICHLVAESNEMVYEWISSAPDIEDFRALHTSWRYHDNPDEDVYEEGFKERIIECNGEMYDEEADVSDTFYGVTHYGWGLIKENISKKSISLLKECGIKVFTC